MAGVFITGTDTGIGKTTVAAGILKLLYGSKKVSYWKPVQTGTIIGDDTKEVKELTSLDDASFLEPGCRFPDPVAPMLAAKQFGKTIDLDKLMSFYNSVKEERFLVMEGAGGLLVPMTEETLLVDFVKRLSVPVIVVAPNRLGTINQTLLTLQCCRENGLEVLGVVLTRSEPSARHGNAECIEKFGKVSVLAELKNNANRRDTVTEVATHSAIRKSLGMVALP